MQLLFWLFLVLVVVISLIGWGCLIVEKIQQKRQIKRLQPSEQLKRKLKHGLWGLLMLTILTGCCANTGVRIEIPSCPPLLREATYKAMQADERRDYRIAVEKCQQKG